MDEEDSAAREVGVSLAQRVVRTRQGRSERGKIERGLDAARITVAPFE